LSITRRNAVNNNYLIELKDIDLELDFINKSYSLSGFKGLIQRFLELEKYMRNTRRFKCDAKYMSVMIKIESLNEMLSYLNDYEENRLYERYEREVKSLELFKELF